MRTFKSVKQNYLPPKELVPLFEEFRWMINEAIRIGLEKRITSRFKLTSECYPKFKNEFYSSYRLEAINKAIAILRNYRRKPVQARRPYVWKKFITMATKDAFKIDNGSLSLSIKPRKKVSIPLNRHTLEVLSDNKLCSVNVTESQISLQFSKEIFTRNPVGFIGVDRNLRNITIASTNDDLKVFNTSKVIQKKLAYSEVKSHFRRNDDRISKQISEKYGIKQSEFENQVLHKISKEIVNEAQSLNFGIVMENLKGMRNLYRAGNGQGRGYRKLLNAWSFAKLQKMIEYKALWKDVRVKYVNKNKTSSLCATCGSRVTESTDRTVSCLKCQTRIDRDINAAKNILANGTLKFGVIGSANEAMNGNGTNSLILSVDADKSSG